MSNLEHLCQSYLILFHFNYSIHSLCSPHLLYMAITKKEEKTLWTFCLIKGLDTLPWSCRKAPFISSYWIFVCVVAVLFNFMLQFVFIRRQQRESVGIQNNTTQSLSISAWALIGKYVRALPSKCSWLFLHQRKHGIHPALAHIACKNILSLFL